MTTEVAPETEREDVQPPTVLDLLVIGLHYVPEPSGNAPYTAGLAQGLKRTGHQVRVITAYPHYPWWQIRPGYEGSEMHEMIGDVPVHRLRPWVPRRQGLLQRVAMETLFGLRAARAPWGRPARVVLVSPALFSTAVLGVVARFRRVPVTIWVQDIYSLGVRETGHARPLAYLIERLERTVLGFADSVVVIHDRFARVLVDRLGVAAERVHVVRNWSHVAQAEGLDRAAARARLGWGEDEVVVLHAGNMGAKQGLENVVDAAAVAVDRGSPVRFVLLGDGNQRATLEARAVTGARLTFVDPLPDAEYLDAMNAADVLLVNERPGLSEMSVPSKLTSYLSTGLPVVAATDPDSITAEEVARAGAGLRVDPTDPAALVLACEQLGSDPELSRTLGASGREFRAAHLSEQAAVIAFEKVLTEAS